MNNNEFIGLKGDMYFKQIVSDILNHGSLDENPRPKYEDGIPAHTLSINHRLLTYDVSKGECPLTTLRPIAIKNSIKEIFWIYQDASNDLKILREKYGVKYWDQWALPDDTIGCCYGETVRRHNLMHNLLDDIKNDPDGRRHIMSLWQEEDFKEPHALKPCCFQTIWNVRHSKDGVDYLDMLLTIRSSDFLVAGAINQFQYMVLLMLVAKHCGYIPGKFSVLFNNIQIYDRHIEIAKEMLNRNPISCTPVVKLNPEKTNFYDFTIDDIIIEGYDNKLIGSINTQFKFDLGI